MPGVIIVTNNCLYCQKEIAQNPEYFFFFKDRNILIKPGFCYSASPSICPDCYFRIINKYMKECGDFINEIADIQNNKISINWERFWLKFENSKTDSMSMDVWKFLCWIGILTQDGRGYFLIDGNSLEKVMGRNDYYFFVRKEDAYGYVRFYENYSGIRKKFSIGYMPNSISHEEIFSTSCH